MALTREFKDTVMEMAKRSPEFRIGLLEEALEALSSGELETGKILLRDYVNATVGFQGLGTALDKSPKSLMRMLSASGNPRAENLFSVVAHLKKREGVSLSLQQQG